MNLITSWLGKEDYFLKWLIWSRDLNLVYHFPVLNQGHGKSKPISVFVYTAAFGSATLCPHLSVFAQTVPQLCVAVKSRVTPGYCRKKTQFLTPERSCEIIQIHVCLKDQRHEPPGMSQQKWWHSQTIFCCSSSETQSPVSQSSPSVHLPNQIPNFAAFSLWQLMQRSFQDLTFSNLAIFSVLFVHPWANKAWKSSLHSFSPIISVRAIHGEFPHSFLKVEWQMIPVSVSVAVF